jgi:hypothetical protein
VVWLAYPALRDMEKLGSVFIGVVDFFAALLPGLATIGVLLFLAPVEYHEQLREIVTTNEAALSAFAVAAYILGQTMNAVGGFVLDVIYDVFYDPRQGLFVGTSAQVLMAA